jgi:hypothetical protein
MSIDPSVPVATALGLGSYVVANAIHVAEPAGVSRDRMGVAVDALADQLRSTAGDFFVAGTAVDMSSLLDGASEDDRRLFLIELALANPFAPHWFEMSRSRDTARVNALRGLANASLGLDLDAVDQISDRWKVVLREETAKRDGGERWRRLAIVGAGGLAVAGLAIVAGPLIAVAMPAAAGLGGAAAMSAGLAQLGFGSIAAGGLGMTGGLWMLGLAGGAVGVGGAAASQAVVKQLVSVAGSANLIQLELCKLVLDARLANEFGWFNASIAEFDGGVDRLATAIDAELELERRRNDPKAERVKELEDLAKTASYAGTAIHALLPADATD